ncbi:MAG: DUF2933 domain-containing protein [Candidatus Rokubacteria bacterium]|nr:DUF2933 domain-containing protein [Candidatus Rokubacteria bacterium]
MKRWLLIGGGLVLLALFVLPDLGIPAGQVFVFLLVLLCPLMHFFMGHGSHGHGHGGGETPKPPAPGPTPLSAPEGEETAGSPR